MNALDTKLAIDAVLAAANAVLPQAEEFDRFVGDRSAAVGELTSLRVELGKVREAMASAKSELEAAKSQLQVVKDETAWALRDLGRIRQELDDLVRQRSRRG